MSKYGWVHQHPDQRDLWWHPDFKTAKASLKGPGVDLRPGLPPVWDQGAISSCTSHAIAAGLEFALLKANPKYDQELYRPSRLYIYYKERLMEGTVNSDSGAMLRDGLKVSAKGFCVERDWPYDVTKWNVSPDKVADKDALQHHAITYQSVNIDPIDFKQVLISGFPVIFGITVYESFESDETAQTGIVSMPGPDERVVGGHAVLACGFNPTTRAFLCRNSWSIEWGLNGYFWLPFSYVDPNLASDAWVVTKDK